MLKLAAAGLVIAGETEIDGDGNSVLRIETQVDGEGALQASHHENGADQQNHRERDLRGHQDLTQMPAAEAGPKCRIFERGNQIGSGRLESRSEAEQEGGQEAGGGCES